MMFIKSCADQLRKGSWEGHAVRLDAIRLFTSPTSEKIYLKNVASWVLNVKMDIADVLHNVPKDTVNELLSSVEEKGDLQVLIRCARRLEKANSMDCETQKSQEFQGICLSLAKVGLFTKAINLADRISDPICKDSACFQNCQLLLKAGRLDAALHEADKIECNIPKRDDAHSLICEDLVKAGRLDEAILEADKISPNHTKKDRAYIVISRSLAENSRFKEAKQIALQISNEQVKAEVLADIKRVKGPSCCTIC
jgi:tetratricopeptide (TPR) repeat protein